MQVSTQFNMRVVHIGSSAYGFERRRFIWFHSLRFTRSQGWTLSNARLIVSLIVLGLLIERFRMPSYFYSRRSLFGLLIERFRMLLFRILILFMALFLLNAFERYAIFMFVKYLIHTFYFQFKLSRHYYFVQPRTRVQTMQRNGLCCKLHFFLSLFSFTYSVPRYSDWWPVRGMSHVSPYCI